MNQIRVLLLDLIRGLDPSSEEIGDHLARVKRLGGELPAGWEHWPSELLAMQRDGLVKREGEALVFVPGKAKPEQAKLGNDILDSSEF
jgi:hypothetical protein